MKRIALAFLLALALPAIAANHSVTLNWTASPDSTAASPGTVTVYRSSGVYTMNASGLLSCPTATLSGTAPSYVAISTTAPAAGPYSDNAVVPGDYCYTVTATIGNATSLPSNTVGTVILPLAPAALAVASSQ